MAERSPYSDTMNLPRTDFSMRASLPAREPERLAAWHSEGLYERLRRARAGRREWVLHDGPPYANGDIHIGTAMNKILKDIANRARWHEGDDVAYVPGWDTHGMPIEHRALGQLGLDQHRVDPLEVRRLSRDFAERHLKAMTEQFRRFGVLGDWQRPYVTMASAYEAAEVRVFGRLYERGLIVRGLRSVLWCPECETALADAEIEYGPERSPSLYVAFPLAAKAPGLPADSQVVIWTTTAWTLPANVAVAVHPDLEYEAVPTRRGHLVVAQARAEAALAEMGLERQGEGPRLHGRDLSGLLVRPPFSDAPVPVVSAEYVTAEDGTGLVHTAPGHGPEDFATGRAYGLDVRVAVDGSGRMTDVAGPFAGMDWLGAEEAITRALDERGVLLGYSHIEHDYPHCWRSKGPVLYRATEQWFCSLDPLREDLERAVGGVEWHPAWGRERMSRMLAERDDWCISRQRVWGLPIPALWCEGCGLPVVTPATIEHIAQVFEREGTDSWWAAPASRFWPQGVACPSCGGGEFRLDPDTLDVWFDSGSSQAAVLGPAFGLHWPADLYLEGSDQFRGWFNSSMITAVATRGTAPYLQNLCHGFVVDGEGRKMSKSLGNGIDAMEAVERRGADVLRLWVVSSDFTADTRLSEAILDQTGDAYRKLRNTIRFLLGTVSDFDPDKRPAAPAYSALDEWALERLRAVAQDCLDDYRDLRYHSVYQRLYGYAVGDLSAGYLDMVKDRLYADPVDGAARRATQYVLWQIARAFILLLEPFVPFTADEAWSFLPRGADAPDRAILAEWPELPAARPEALSAVEALGDLRSRALAALEAARADGLLGSALEAAIEVGPTAAERSALTTLGADAEAFFGVSAIQLRPEAATEVRVRRAPGERCARCWRVYGRLVPAEPAAVCERCERALEAFTEARAERARSEGAAGEAG